jgi:hypothetical protein
MPVTLPAADGLAGSITRVAAIMRQRKDPTRATSVTLPRPLFRLLAPTGYCAAACGDPIPNITGNIPVTFAALSYAGTLRLTLLSGPAQVPDAEMLTTAMRQELSSASGADRRQRGQRSHLGCIRRGPNKAIDRSEHQEPNTPPAACE